MGYSDWPSGVAQSVLTQSQLRCCSMTSRERLTPGIPRILLAWNGFVQRNAVKFFLIVLQAWPTTTGNICLRLLLPKEVQPVIESKGSLFFLIWMFASCVQEKNETHNLIWADCVCLVMRLRWISEHISWPIYTEIQVIPKRLHTGPPPQKCQSNLLVQVHFWALSYYTSKPLVHLNS